MPPAPAQHKPQPRAAAARLPAPGVPARVPQPPSPAHGCPAHPLRRSKRYACSYLATDLVACIPFNCIAAACQPHRNWWNLWELFK